MAAYEHLKELNMFGPASGALARPGHVHVVVTSHSVLKQPPTGYTPGNVKTVVGASLNECAGSCCQMLPVFLARLEIALADVVALKCGALAPGAAQCNNRGAA